MFSVADFRRRGIVSVSNLFELTRLYERWDGLITFRAPATDSAD